MRHVEARCAPLVLLTFLLSVGVMTVVSRTVRAETCDGGDRPSPPFLSTVHRGIEGRYHIFGRDWSYDPAAYSWRYHTAWDRLSVFAGDRVSGEAIRVRQPPGCGPPLTDLHRRFSVAEIELYDRPEPDVARYRRSGNLVSAGTTVRTSDSRPGHEPEHLTDGWLVCPDNAPAWESSSSDDEHWIEIELDGSVTWNQIVLYWPTRREIGPWAADVEVVEGLRSQCLCFQIRREGVWHDVELEEIRPGALHDGAFVAELTGLEGELPGRLSHLETFNRWTSMIIRDPDARLSPQEIEIGDGWTIAIPAGSSDLVQLAARELETFLIESMGCRALTVRELPVNGEVDGDATPPNVASRTIVLSSRHAMASMPGGTRPDSIAAMLDSAEVRVESFAIVVTPDVVWAVGHDSLGTRYAACRLEERMRRRRAPYLQPGVEHRRPAFQPRIATSVAFGQGGPDGFGFPDEYLSLLAHYYLDGIYIFQNGFFLNDPYSVIGLESEPTLDGDPEKAARLRNLVRRARSQGLGVYWCLTVPGVLPREFYADHPDIGNGAPASVCYSSFDTRTLIQDSVKQLLREVPGLAGLVVLRSELNHGCGGYHNCVRCKRGRARQNDPALKVMEWVFKAVREVDADVDVIAFDWRGGMQRTYRKRLPAGIGYWVRPDTLHKRSPENHLAMTAPPPDLVRSLSGGSPDQRVWVELQPSHPFPFHLQPEMPVAEIYYEKIAQLRRLMAQRPEDSPPFGYAQGNGGGFTPFAMTELVNQTLLWDPLPSRDVALGSIAESWYGPGAANDVLAAWKLFSDAIREHGRFSKYLIRRSLIEPPGEFDPGDGHVDLAHLDALAVSWRAGVERLEVAHDHAPDRYRELAEINLDMARGALLAITSLRHAVRWFDRFGVSAVDELTDRIEPTERELAVEILEAERENLDRVIELYGRRSVFRYHPYYRNRFSLPVLVGKRRAIEERLRALDQ